MIGIQNTRRGVSSITQARCASNLNPPNKSSAFFQKSVFNALSASIDLKEGEEIEWRISGQQCHSLPVVC